MTRRATRRPSKTRGELLGMANLLRPDELGPAEAAYRAVAAIARIVPE